MEKILQILSVFALVILAVTYFTRGMRPKYKEYRFIGRKKGGMPSEVSGYLLEAFLVPVAEGEGEARMEGEGLAEGEARLAGGDLTGGEGRMEGGDSKVGAVDPDNQLLFRRSVKDAKLLEMVDERTGVILASLPLQFTVDALLFDREERLIYCCSVQGNLYVIGQLARQEYKILESIVVPEGCTSLAVDPSNKNMYLQCGEYYYTYLQA